MHKIITLLHFPAIFWLTVAVTFVTLAVFTLIGRAIAGCFPSRQAGVVRFYLAPVLGMGALVVVATLLGRVVPLGERPVIWAIIAGMLFLALFKEKKIKAALCQAAWVGLFGSLCGLSVFIGLAVFGAFNAHNDAFTYLVISDWLQQHAFNQIIARDQITPFSTQVSIYQYNGFRMGANYLLALVQGAFHLRWAMDVYCAVSISAIGTSCLSLGYPLARSLRSMRRPLRLALLSLPAFSLGGLVFAGNFGFLPQTIGLATGAGLLFIVGPTIRRLGTREAIRYGTILKLAMPAGMLLAASISAYSELAPFLLAAAGLVGIVQILHSHRPKVVVSYAFIVVGLAIILLNTELMRVYHALHTQAGVVVGGAVDWSLLGYVAHAFGLHGGAWDAFQWTLPGSTPDSFFIGVTLLVLVLACLLLGLRDIKRLSRDQQPVFAILAIFVVALIYFRYAVPSPFNKGVGESWSQFKLMDWAHPFATVILLQGILALRKPMGKWLFVLIVVTLTLSTVAASKVEIARMHSLTSYYGDTKDLRRFYKTSRDVVVNSCPKDAPIYFVLNGDDLKYREMLVYLLQDREVRSDWTNDIYINGMLPANKRSALLEMGNCIIERSGKGALLKSGVKFGKYEVGVFDGPGNVQIVATEGAYDREMNDQDWWNWVERKVTYKLQSFYVVKDNADSRLYFEYSTRGAQHLTVNVRTSTGKTLQYKIATSADKNEKFEQDMGVSPSELTEISIETDGSASRLGPHDDRMAAFVVRNLAVVPIHN